MEKTFSRRHFQRNFYIISSDYLRDILELILCESLFSAYAMHVAQQYDLM